MNHKYCVLLVLSMTILAVQAEVKTMRCSNKLVSVGDRTFEVSRKCGEPNYRSFVGYTGGVRSAGDLPIEEWFYNHKTGSATSYNLLRFEGGKLTLIESHFPTN